MQVSTITTNSHNMVACLWAQIYENSLHFFEVLFSGQICIDPCETQHTSIHKIIIHVYHFIKIEIIFKKIFMNRVIGCLRLEWENVKTVPPLHKIAHPLILLRLHLQNNDYCYDKKLHFQFLLLYSATRSPTNNFIQLTNKRSCQNELTHNFTRYSAQFG